MMSFDKGCLLVTIGFAIFEMDCSEWWIWLCL